MLWLGLLAAAPLAARAEDLLQVYRDAQSYDATYASARYALVGGRERLPQGRALLLPTLGLSGNATHERFDSTSHDQTLAPGLTFGRSADVTTYTLTLAQPLFRPQNWTQYKQAGFQVAQAEAAFSQAGEDLIVRTAQAYFDVLAAQDSLAFVRAQKAATAEQLAAAKRNFEVGTATITDTHEAQARYDLIQAQEIASQNDLETKRRALQAITGKLYERLSPLRPGVKIAPPNPENMDQWVGLAEKQSYTVVQQQAAAQVAALGAKLARAAHAPTIDAVATYGQTSQNASATSPFGSDLNVATIGLQFSLPIYQGGALSSREREAAALSLRATEDLENARRTAALNAQQNYLAVINGIAQVGALEQALVSSQSALESNKLGYEVGVRINIDVLNAQQQLYSTERDLAVARYNTITNQLRLKASAGSLNDADIEEVNRALAH